MSFQAYLDNIKAKTGKTPEDFRVLAKQKGLVKNSEIVAWLKAEFGLGHGHANAIAMVILQADHPKSSSEENIAAHFTGNKARWRGAYDAIAVEIVRFGADVDLSPNRTNINVLRAGKKFAIVQVSSVDRLDIGIKLKGVAPSGRFEVAGAWNAMVTHRVSINESEQIDAELLSWLKHAYEAA